MIVGDKMKKHILWILLLLFLIFILLWVFFTIKNQKSIIGKWKAIETEDEYYYIFNKDNTCSYEMTYARLDCTYKKDKETLTILYKGNNKSNTYKYHFKNKILIIKDNTGKDNKFIKEK